MGDAEVNKIIHANALTVFVYKSALGECKIFALIIGGCNLVGEVSYVYFPNNRVGIGLNTGRELCTPAFGIGAGKIHNHTAVTVEACCLCVGVNCFLCSNRCGYRVGIICTVSAVFGIRPYTTVALCHINTLVSVAFVTGRKEVENYLRSCGSPYLESSIVAIDNSAEVISVIGVVFNKVFAIKNRSGNNCFFSVTFNYYAIVFADVKCFFHFNNAAGDLSAHIADFQNGEFFVTLVYLYLLIACNGCFGSDVVLNLVEIGHSCKSKLFNHSKRFASVLAGILCCVATLEEDEGFFALDYCKAVFAGSVLGGFSPRGSTGFGTIGTHDKSDLLNANGNIENNLCAVIARVHNVSATFFAIPPSPNVTVFNNTGVRPIECDLIVAFFFGNGVFAFRNLPFAVFGGLFRSGCGVVLIRVGACRQHGNNHNCNEKERKNARISLFHNFTS